MESIEKEANYVAKTKSGTHLFAKLPITGYKISKVVPGINDCAASFCTPRVINNKNNLFSDTECVILC